jgi:hypothetical protein
MKFLIRLVVVMGVVGCTVVAVASAAAPKAGRTYRGESASHHSLRIVVAKDGKTGVLSYCGAFKAKFHIVKGHFGIRLTEASGAVSIFRVHGGWTTSKLVQGRIDLVLGCDGRPGPWSATLK